MTDHRSLASPSTSAVADEHELLRALFDLGREVTAVLDLDELLQKIPQLIARITDFQAFAVYLLDPRRGELSIAYSVGYPESRTGLRLKVGEGLVGAAVAEERPLVVNDVHQDPRYVEAVPGSNAELVVPMRRKGKTIGALNLLSRHMGQFTETDAAVLRQFAAHVAVAIENARLFEREREYGATLETLAEIGREVSSILEPDELLSRIAQLLKRVIDYRTFGILLLDGDTGELEMKLALQYGEKVTLPKVKLGEGIVGYAALHKEPVLVSDVTKDTRYLKVVEDVRSELAIPLLLKDRCVGVFDLESPELDAFTKTHVEILTLLASHAAVAIENARLYHEIVANEERLDRELRFAQRVQAALLPTGLPKKVKGVDVAARFEPARELGGDLYDFLVPDANTLVIAVGDVSGKGIPAALYGAVAGELVRSRTFRRRYLPDASSPATVLASINTILHERQLEAYYCTLCYAAFDLKRRIVTLANSGLPYPLRSTTDGARAIDATGLPLGTFPGTTYDEVSFPLVKGDTYVFCSDGIFEAENATGEDFGVGRVSEIVQRSRELPAAKLAETIFDAVAAFQGDAPHADDMTAVVVKITY